MAIEEELLLEFSRAQVRNDKKAMKKYIKLLSKFKVKFFFSLKISHNSFFFQFRVIMIVYKILLLIV
jgi:hypothetical protein